MAKRKPGKYDEVIKTLEQKPVEDAGYQGLVDQLKATITKRETHTPESLVKSYQIARFGTGATLSPEDTHALVRNLGVEGLKALQSVAQLHLTAFEQLLIESHDHDETGWGLYGAADNAVRTQAGAVLRVQPEVSVKVEDKEAYRLWCVDAGLEKSMSLHQKTTESMTKQLLVAGKTVPAGVRATTYQKVVFRKEGASSEDDE